MEGRHWAILVSFILWGISCLIGWILVHFILSKGLIPTKLREKLSPVVLIILAMIAIIGLPYLSAMAFKLGDYLEGDYPIIWGCYLELFWLFALFLILIVLIQSFIFLIIGVVKPDLLRYSNRIRAVSGALIWALYPLIMMYLFNYAIINFSGDLYKITWSCF